METTDLQKLLTIAAVLLIAVGVYLGVRTPPFDTAAPLLGAVPTFQPTPALEVPTPRPTVPVVYESSSQVITYVNQDVDIDVCVGWCP